MENILHPQTGPWENPPMESDLDPSTTSEKGILQTITGMMSIASLMRLVGALTVVAAMSAFLLQDWAAGNDISRYYLLLSQTALLTAGGFGLSYLIKENKGARVFFGLSLLSITVNMATIGALVFSMIQWGGSSLAQYPDFATWKVTNFAAVLPALAATLAVSAPIALFSYKVLARRSAYLLTGLSLFANLLLLVPVRESLLVGMLAIAAVLIPLELLRQRIEEDNTLRTPEGWLAIASVFAPAMVIVCRSLWFYPIDDLLHVALAGTVFFGLRFSAPHSDIDSLARKISNWLSVGAALAIASPLSSIVHTIISGDFGRALEFSIFGFIFAALMIDIAKRSKSAGGFICLAALVLGVCHVVPVALDISFISPILCVAAGVVGILMGRHFNSVAALVMGGITIAAGGARQIIEIIELINFSSWMTLAIIGCSVIVAASLLERHGAVLKLKWEKFLQSQKL